MDIPVYFESKPVLCPVCEGDKFELAFTEDEKILVLRCHCGYAVVYPVGKGVRIGIIRTDEHGGSGTG